MNVLGFIITGLSLVIIISTIISIIYDANKTEKKIKKDEEELKDKRYN
jgi:hypothetical protein